MCFHLSEASGWLLPWPSCEGTGRAARGGACAGISSWRLARMGEERREAAWRGTARTKLSRPSWANRVGKVELGALRRHNGWYWKVVNAICMGVRGAQSGEGASLCTFAKISSGWKMWPGAIIDRGNMHLHLPVLVCIIRTFIRTAPALHQIQLAKNGAFCPKMHTDVSTARAEVLFRSVSPYRYFLIHLVRA